MSTAFTAAACERGDPDGTSEARSDSVPVWRLSEVADWSIGEIEGPPEHQWSGVTGVGLSDSLVFVFDRSSAEIRVFDLQGEHLASLGGSGEGPGEFSPNVFFEEDHDSLIAFDQRQRRVTWFSPALELRSTVVLGSDLSNPRLIGVLADGSYLMEELRLGFADVTGRGSSELIAARISPVDLTVDTIGVFDGIETVRWSQTGMGLAIFSPSDRLDGDRDGLWVLDGGSGRVQLLSGTGDSVSSFAAELPRAPITDEDVDDYFSPLLDGPPDPELRESMRAKRAVALERGTFPVADRLFVEGPGRVWIRAYSSDMHSRDTWHVFDRSGAPLGRLEAPASFEILDAAEAGVVGVYRDDLALEHVRYYRLQRIALSPAEPACGVYRYSYPHNTERLNEDHFIRLDCSGQTLRGWYWGTSDDFDRGREGYLPGFFVVEMSDLAMTEDSIRFTLQVAEEEYFARPIPLRFHDAEQVPGHLNEPWAHGIRTEPRQYRGVVHPDSIVLEVDGRERVFCRLEGSRGCEVVPGTRE